MRIRAGRRRGRYGPGRRGAFDARSTSHSLVGVTLNGTGDAGNFTPIPRGTQPCSRDRHAKHCQRQPLDRKRYLPRVQKPHVEQGNAKTQEHSPREGGNNSSDTEHGRQEEEPPPSSRLARRKRSGTPIAMNGPNTSSLSSSTWERDQAAVRDANQSIEDKCHQIELQQAMQGAVIADVMRVSAKRPGSPSCSGARGSARPVFSAKTVERRIATKNRK